MSTPNGLICVILDIGLRASVTPASHRASVTPVITKTMSTQSTDLGRLGLMLESMGQTELDIALMSLVLLGEIVTLIVKLFPSDTLTQVNTLRHRHARSRSRSYDSVSPRRHSRSPSRSRGKKKSHKKRKHSSTSCSSSRRSSSSSSRERERKRHKSKKKKKKHSKSRSFKRDKREKKHKRKRSPSPSPSSSVSSDSSSSLQRSPAKKKFRINSRSPSPADDNPHSASRTASPVSHRDHLSLYADNDDEFNSHSEDNQDLAPDTEIQNVSEIQSDVSTNDMRFQNLVEEVLKLLPADMFPKKTQSVRSDAVDHWSVL